MNAITHTKQITLYFIYLEFTGIYLVSKQFSFISSFVKMSGGPYNYSYIFKYIIIGDMGVGKSCLLHQFTEKKCKLLI